MFAALPKVLDVIYLPLLPASLSKTQATRQNLSQNTALAACWWKTPHYAAVGGPPPQGDRLH